MIDRDGHARLTDFGLISIIREENSVVSPQDSDTANTTTWAAPEILEGGPASKEGDIFTFAMVAVEVRARGISGRSSIPPTLRVFEQTFTGNPPFVMSSHTATVEILNGKRPGRPVTLRHQGLWGIITRSWSKMPRERPTAFELVKFFQES